MLMIDKCPFCSWQTILKVAVYKENKRSAMLSNLHQCPLCKILKHSQAVPSAEARQTSNCTTEK